MKPVLLALFVLLVTAAGLAGCGQKGDLYLPGHNPNPPEPLAEPADQDHSKSDDQNNDNNHHHHDKQTAPADSADSNGA